MRWRAEFLTKVAVTKCYEQYMTDSLAADPAE